MSETTEVIAKLNLLKSAITARRVICWARAVRNVRSTEMTKYKTTTTHSIKDATASLGIWFYSIHSAGASRDFIISTARTMLHIVSSYCSSLRTATAAATAPTPSQTSTEEARNAMRVLVYLTHSGDDLRNYVRDLYLESGIIHRVLDIITYYLTLPSPRPSPIEATSDLVSLSLDVIQRIGRHSQEAAVECSTVLATNLLRLLSSSNKWVVHDSLQCMTALITASPHAKVVFVSNRAHKIISKLNQKYKKAFYIEALELQIYEQTGDILDHLHGHA